MNTSVKREMYNEASILDNTEITVNWESRQKISKKVARKGCHGNLG